MKLLGNVRIIFDESFLDYFTLSYRISGRDSFYGGKVCNTPLLLTKIKTLFKYFILGELKTFAKQCACVLSSMTSCVFVYDFM
jgi:hypothetical protein